MSELDSPYLYLNRYHGGSDSIQEMLETIAADLCWPIELGMMANQQFMGTRWRISEILILESVSSDGAVARPCVSG